MTGGDQCTPNKKNPTEDHMHKPQHIEDNQIASSIHTQLKA